MFIIYLARHIVGEMIVLRRIAWFPVVPRTL